VIKAQGKAVGAVVSSPLQVEEILQKGKADDEVLTGIDDPGLELKFRIAAIPVMLLLAVLFHLFTPFLQRTFLAMPVHELGHASFAWFTGHWAIPTLWKTINGEERGLVTPLLLVCGFGWIIWSGWRAENYPLAALGGALVLLLGVGTLVLKEHTAQMLIVFGGDGGGMILGTALMATFFFGRDTQLYKGSLRWGFAAIGAAAFVDPFAVWLAARGDFGKLPLGEEDGMQSDAVKLVDDFGWDADAMIRRYVALGICCLVALAVVYAWGVWQARRAIK